MRTPVPILLPAALILALSLGAGGVSAQEERQSLPGVAVLDFEGFLLGESGNSAPLGKAVASMLVTELAPREGIRVIERQQLQSVLVEQRLALSGRVDQATAIEVGRLVGARYVIAGQVSGVGEMARMDMRIVDVETSEVLETRKLSGRTMDLLSMVVEIADGFGERLSLALPEERPTPATIPVQATIAFSRAVDFEDKGETARALELYREALRLAPGHQAAQAGVDRLTAGGGEEP